MTLKTGTFWQRLTNGVWRTWRDADWPDLEPEDILGADALDRFHAKQGRSIARWTIQGPTKRWAVYLKRHYRAPRWQGFLATLWPRHGWSAAWQEAAHLRWATAHGFPVPHVAAVGERVGPRGRVQSYLAIEELADMLPLHEAVPLAADSLPPNALTIWKHGLTGELARLAARLHGLRYFHKDMYLCHFYVPKRFTQVVPATWAGQVHMIDLHRLAYHPWAWRWWQVKDLAQLLYSSEVAGVSVRDRIRFWRQYAGDWHNGVWGRFLQWAVHLRWRNYRTHNAGRIVPPNRSAA